MASEPIDWEARKQRQTYESIWKLAEDNSNKIDELEQQLADTREELRITLAQRQDYQAAAAQARALLENIDLNLQTNADVKGNFYLEVIRDRVHAFLAQHKE